MKEIVLIPAYKPDEKLIALLRELKSAEFDVLIVNDGSGKKFDEIFEKAAEYAEIISHEHNKGKGTALKTGISHIKNAHPECEYFITADADGQHRIKDILKVRKVLSEGAKFVLTERNLKGNIPFASKIGNGLSKIVYTLMSGHYFDDNQSGLRGFSTDNCQWLISVEGERYDYELNMLYAADKQKIPITEVSIETVYINGNKSSHFHPLHDTIRLYKQLFSTGYISIITFFIWEIAVLIASIFLNEKLGVISVLLSGIVSCILCVLGGKFISFSSFEYKDGLRTFSCALFRAAFCCILCCIYLLIFNEIPLFGIFNAALLIDILAEYVLYKTVSLKISKLL